MERLTRCLVVTGVAAAGALGLLGGCDYSSRDAAEMPTGTLIEGARPAIPAAGPKPIEGPTVGGKVVGVETGDDKAKGAAEKASAARIVSPGASEEKRAAILTGSIQLIKSAAVSPGGANFGRAIKNLNQYFAGTPQEDYILPKASREFLETVLPRKKVDELEAPDWNMPDARHVEDCMMYHGLATRVAGVGDDLTKARRVFDWMVRQVQLVPAGSLAAPQLGQAYARPFDVLLRGMATESEGFWSERGWLFLSLCRQLGLDGGLVTYTPAKAKEPVIWCVAILVDGKPYLFDTRVGLPVADATGKGVATIEDVMTDPKLLAKMDLPGQSEYGTTAAALNESGSKVGILLDASLRYFSPRMKLLQRSLAGQDLTVLYRDPALQRDQWVKALGPRLGKVGLWELPMAVERLLFSDPNFVRSTQHALFLFQPSFRLMYARMKELRGETKSAIEDLVSLRFAENATLLDGKTPMPKEVQEALDVYATYFLAMCQLDLGDLKQAEFFFDRTLKMLPAPGAGQPYFNMYRWGAQANLARLREAKGDASSAVAWYNQPDPTSQRHGNLLRARDLVWKDPLSPLPAAVPPPPPPVPTPGTGVPLRSAGN